MKASFCSLNWCRPYWWPKNRLQEAFFFELRYIRAAPIQPDWGSKRNMSKLETLRESCFATDKWQHPAARSKSCRLSHAASSNDPSDLSSGRINKMWGLRRGGVDAMKWAVYKRPTYNPGCEVKSSTSLVSRCCIACQCIFVTSIRLKTSNDVPFHDSRANCKCQIWTSLTLNF